MYGHRISGRMDFLIAVGPQFTHTDANQSVCVFLGLPLVGIPLSDCTTSGGALEVDHVGGNHVGVAGRVQLHYRFPKTTVSLSFQRYNTNGSGIFAGSLSNTAHPSARRPLKTVFGTSSLT